MSILLSLNSSSVVYTDIEEDMMDQQFTKGRAIHGSGNTISIRY